MRADLLLRAVRRREAVTAHDRAVDLTRDREVRAFLLRRRAAASP